MSGAEDDCTIRDRECCARAKKKWCDSSAFTVNISVNTYTVIKVDTERGVCQKHVSHLRESMGRK